MNLLPTPKNIMVAAKIPGEINDTDMSDITGSNAYLTIIIWLVFLVILVLSTLASGAISPNISIWTDLLSSYQHDFVFKDLCGAKKEVFVVPRPETPPPSNETRLRASYIIPPRGFRKFKFSLFIQGVRVYQCNTTSLPTKWVQLNSRSCLFHRPGDSDSVAGFIRDPINQGRGLIGTLVGTSKHPISAIQVQLVATQPTPSGNPAIDLGWELTKVTTKYRKSTKVSGIDFTNVDYYNRVFSDGGQTPPAYSCTRAIEGRSVQLPYISTYWMWGK